MTSEANVKPRRRWFQFSLRTLLIVVTLVAGLLVAWRAYVEPYRRQRETMKLVEELGGRYTLEPVDRCILSEKLAVESNPSLDDSC